MTAILHLPTGSRLIYRCDPASDRVVVSDGLDRLQFAFGGHGSRGGQFDTPLDLAFVAPEFQGERLPEGAHDMLWVAVADYGNRRVQVFELDGCFVGSVGGDAESAALGGPCRLTWRSPVLDVERADGRRSGIDLAAALLRESWRAFLNRPRTAFADACPFEVRHA